MSELSELRDRVISGLLSVEHDLHEVKAKRLIREDDINSILDQIYTIEFKVTELS